MNHFESLIKAIFDYRFSDRKVQWLREIPRLQLWINDAVINFEHSWNTRMYVTLINKYYQYSNADDIQQNEFVTPLFYILDQMYKSQLSDRDINGIQLKVWWNLFKSLVECGADLTLHPHHSKKYLQTYIWKAEKRFKLKMYLHWNISIPLVPLSIDTSHLNLNYMIYALNSNDEYDSSVMDSNSFNRNSLTNILIPNSETEPSSTRCHAQSLLVVNSSKQYGFTPIPKKNIMKKHVIKTMNKMKRIQTQPYKELKTLPAAEQLKDKRSMSSLERGIITAHEFVNLKMRVSTYSSDMDIICDTKQSSPIIMRNRRASTKKKRHKRAHKIPSLIPEHKTHHKHSESGLQPKRRNKKKKKIVKKRIKSGMPYRNRPRKGSSPLLYKNASHSMSTAFQLFQPSPDSYQMRGESARRYNEPYTFGQNVIDLNASNNYIPHKPFLFYS